MKVRVGFLGCQTLHTNVVIAECNWHGGLCIEPGHYPNTAGRLETSIAIRYDLHPSDWLGVTIFPRFGLDRRWTRSSHLEPYANTRIRSIAPAQGKLRHRH